MNPTKAILVIGAGDATGGAIARRFAREGYIACMTRRTADKLEPLVQQIRAEGGQAYGFASDARKEEDMVALIEKIEREIAPIEVAVFNIGANVRSSITETTTRVYTKVWEMACPRRLSDGARGGQGDAATRSWHHHLYRGDRQRTRT